MKAAMFYKDRDIRIEEVPIPAVPPGEALIKIRMIGLCGSDAYRYAGKRPVGYHPIILGHE